MKSREEKIKTLKGLLTGKLSIKEASPFKAIFIEVVEIDDQPGKRFRQSGEEITEQEINETVQRAESRGAIVLEEISTYASWEDFKNSKESFGINEPITN